MVEKSIKARGLGRGLDALFGDDEAASTVYQDNESPHDQKSSGRKLIGLEQIVPHPDQPRHYFDEDALKELAASIREHGLLQPILVRPSRQEPDAYEIIAGERRWRASQMAQLHEIPVIIRDLDDEQTYQIALVENLQRKDLSAIEEAIGYQKLVDEFGHSHESIGKVVGKSRSYIANMIRLLALPNAVQVMVEVGDLSVGHARALLGSDHAYELALQILERKLSVRETEKLVSELANTTQTSSSKKKAKGFASKDADHLALEKNLSDKLGVPVTLDMKSDQKGALKIDFKSLDQLDYVLKLLAP